MSIFELGGSGTLLVLGFGASILNVHSGFLSFELLELVLVWGFILKERPPCTKCVTRG